MWYLYCTYIRRRALQYHSGAGCYNSSIFWREYGRVFLPFFLPSLPPTLPFAFTMSERKKLSMSKSLGSSNSSVKVARKRTSISRFVSPGGGAGMAEKRSPRLSLSYTEVNGCCRVDVRASLSENEDLVVSWASERQVPEPRAMTRLGHPISHRKPRGCCFANGLRLKFSRWPRSFKRYQSLKRSLAGPHIGLNTCQGRWVGDPKGSTWNAIIKLQLVCTRQSIWTNSRRYVRMRETWTVSRT